MKPGGFKLNLGGIGSGGGWGVADAETPYQPVLAHTQQHASDVFVEKKKKGTDVEEFDGELMPPEDDDYEEVDEETERAEEEEEEKSPSPDKRNSTTGFAADASLLSQESSSGAPPELSQTQYQQQPLATTTASSPAPNSSTYKAYDAHDDEDDDVNTFQDNGSAAADTPPTMKPPTAPQSAPKKAASPAKPTNTFVQKEQKPHLPPLATQHSDPYKNKGVLPSGGNVDSAHRGGTSSNRSSHTGSGRGLRTVDLPGIKEVKARSGSSGAPPLRKKLCLSGIIAGGDKQQSNKPTSKNAMQGDPAEADDHNGDWVPGKVVHTLKCPFDIKALEMGEGGKDCWAAIGDDPITSFHLVGCDLTQNVQIESVKNVRSLAMVDVVETKNQGFGRPTKDPRANPLNRRSSANSALGAGGGNMGSGAPTTIKGGSRVRSNSPAPLTRDSSQECVGATKVTHLWCGLENGRISIVNLFYNNEEGMIEAHQGRVSMLFPSPSGAVWSSGADKYLKIWDPSTRRCTFTKFVAKPVTEIIAVTSKREIWTSSMNNSITLWDYEGKESPLPSGNNNYRNTHKTPSDIRCLKYHTVSDSVWISLSQSASIVTPRFKLKAKINLIAQCVEFVEDTKVVCLGHGQAISKNQDHVVVYSLTNAENLHASPNGIMGPQTELKPVLLFVGDPLEGVSKVGLRNFVSEDLLIAPHLLQGSSGDDHAQRCISVITHDYMKPVGSWGIPADILKMVQEKEAGGGNSTSPQGVSSVGALTSGSTSSGVRTSGTPGQSTGGRAHKARLANNNDGSASLLFEEGVAMDAATASAAIAANAQRDEATKESILVMNKAIREMESDVKHLRARQPAVVDFARLTNLTMSLQFEFRRTLENYPLEPSELTSLTHLYESDEGRVAAENMMRMKKALTALGGATNVAVASQSSLTPTSVPAAKKEQSPLVKPAIPTSDSSQLNGSNQNQAPGGGGGGGATLGWMTSNGPGVGFDPMTLLKQQERQAKAREERYSELVKSAHAQATATLERSTIIMQGLSRVQWLLEDAANRAAGDAEDAEIPQVPEVTVHSSAEELKLCVQQLRSLTRYVTEPSNRAMASNLAAAAAADHSSPPAHQSATGGMDLLVLSPASPAGSPSHGLHQTSNVSEPASPNPSFALTGGALPPKPVQFHDRITQCVSFVTIELDRVEKEVIDLGRNVTPWRIFLSADPTNPSVSSGSVDVEKRGSGSSEMGALTAGDTPEGLDACGFMSFERRRLFQTLELFVDICQAETSILVCEVCAAEALDETKASHAVAASGVTPLQLKNQERVKELIPKVDDLRAQMFATATAARESLMSSSLYKEIPAEVATNAGKGFLAGYLTWLHIFLYFLCDSLEPAEAYILKAKSVGDHEGLSEALDKLQWWSQRLDEIAGSLRTLRDAVSATRKQAHELSPSARYDRQRVDRTLLEAPTLTAYFFYLCALTTPEPLDRMMCDLEGLDEAGHHVDRISIDAENLLMKIERMSKCCLEISSEDYAGGALKPYVQKFVKTFRV